MAEMTTLDAMPDIAEIPSIGTSEVHDEFTASDHMPLSLELILPPPSILAQPQTSTSTPSQSSTIFTPTVSRLPSN